MDITVPHDVIGVVYHSDIEALKLKISSVGVISASPFACTVITDNKFYSAGTNVTLCSVKESKNITSKIHMFHEV